MPDGRAAEEQERELGAGLEGEPMTETESTVSDVDQKLRERRDEVRHLNKRVYELTKLVERLERALWVETDRRVRADSEARAARDWIDRERKALSKSVERGGHRAASLTILEADLDAARDGGARG